MPVIDVRESNENEVTKYRFTDDAVVFLDSDGDLIFESDEEFTIIARSYEVKDFINAIKQIENRINS